MSSESAQTHARTGASPWPWLSLTGVTLAGWMLVTLYPIILTKLGIGDTKMWYLDTYAVLAACDARAAGLSPDVPNPLDVFGRPHSYSDWWFVLGWLGLGREHNFIVGFSWVILFFASALWALWPRNARQAVVGAALLLSPPVLLAVQRGNNDLVVFFLLAVAGGAMRASGRWRWAVAALAVGLATGLKFYPAAASALFLAWPGRRERIVATLSGVAVAGLVLASVWATVSRGFFLIPLDLHKIGAPILLTDLGLTASAWKGVAVVVILGAGLALACTGWLAGRPVESEGAAERVAHAWFAAAAAVLVGCFLVSNGHAYRLIMLLLIPAWLFAAPAATAARARWGRTLIWILLFVMLWGDGLFCLVINICLQPATVSEGLEWAKVWRLFTQPLHWLFMILLGGWLWRLGLDALKPDPQSAA